MPASERVVIRALVRLCVFSSVVGRSFGSVAAIGAIGAPIARHIGQPRERLVDGGEIIEGQEHGDDGGDVRKGDEVVHAGSVAAHLVCES